LLHHQMQLTMRLLLHFCGLFDAPEARKLEIMVKSNDCDNFIVHLQTRPRRSLALVLGEKFVSTSSLLSELLRKCHLVSALVRMKNFNRMNLGCFCQKSALLLNPHRRILKYLRKHFLRNNIFPRIFFIKNNFFKFTRSESH
jgi:hypothetical protein